MKVGTFGAAIAWIAAAVQVLSCTDNAQQTLEPPAVDATAEISAPSDAAETAVDGAASCNPQPLDRAPQWIPPKPFDQGVCSEPQITAFIAACVGDTTGACEAFTAANTVCATCAFNKDTDTEWGPVAVNEKETYSQLNRAGCVANRIGDISPSGCGAAEGRLTQCAQIACRDCPLRKDQRADADRYVACQDAAYTSEFCKKEYTDWGRKCDAYYEATDPESPGTYCKAHGTLGEYIRLWCGATPDGGTDAGDGG